MKFERAGQFVELKVFDNEAIAEFVMECGDSGRQSVYVEKYNTPALCGLLGRRCILTLDFYEPVVPPTPDERAKEDAGIALTNTMRLKCFSLLAFDVNRYPAFERLSLHQNNTVTVEHIRIEDGDIERFMADPCGFIDTMMGRRVVSEIR